MKKKVKDFGFVFWFHLIIILLCYFSPFLFRWQLIAFFIFLYYLQQVIFGECVLTKLQFHDERIEFYYYYFKKIGLNISKKKLHSFTIYILPIIIVLVTLIWQIVLKKLPLFF